MAQVLRNEKESLVKKDQALAAKFKQFQEEMIRLQVTLDNANSYTNNKIIVNNNYWVIIGRVSVSNLEVAETSLTGKAVF